MIELIVAKFANMQDPALFVMGLACLRIYQQQPLFPKAEKMLYIIPSSISNVSVLAANFSTPSPNDYHPKRASIDWVSLFCL
jgi:hypothetical protein